MSDPTNIAAELRALQARLRGESESSAPTRVAAGSQVPARSIRGDAALAQPKKKPPRRIRRRRARRAFIASLEARGARGCRPRDFKARTQGSVRAVFENRSGREARLALPRFPRAMRPMLVWIARHPEGKDGRELAADLHEQWSRWVISTALLLWCERRRSRRKGCRAMMDGFTQGMICGLFRNRDGEAYSRSRVFGTSYRAGSLECSPFVALERGGIVFWGAPRTEDANPRFIGPPRLVGDRMRRFAFAVYWLRRDVGSG